MGATLTTSDFKRVLLRPRDVGVGVVAQYAVMPFLGFALAKIFELDPMLAAGVVLVGFGGLVALADWMFGETDERLFEKTDKLYHSTHAQYHAITDWFEQLCHVYTINPQEYDRVIRNFSEQLLYDVATKIWCSNEYEAPYRSKLRATVQQLRAYQAKLNKRICKIRDQNYVNTHADRLLHDMESLEQSIQNKLVHFVFFSDYLEHHSSYFTLYECEGIINDEYQEEFELLTNHTYSRYTFAQELKYVITKKQKDFYPYITYIKQLNRQLNKIKNCKSHLAYNYVDRISWAQKVIDSLEYIRGIAVTDPLYQQELRAQEREKLERERISVVQQQTLIEKNKANLLEKQNQLLERELALKEEELREKYGDQSPNIHAHVTIQL